MFLGGMGAEREQMTFGSYPNLCRSSARAAPVPRGRDRSDTNDNIRPRRITELPDVLYPVDAGEGETGAT